MRRQTILFALLFVFILAGMVRQFWLTDSYPATSKCESNATGAMVKVAGGTLQMGADNFEPEERPVRAVDVAPFAIMQHEVTNRQFKAFVDATGYQTVAERGLSREQFPGMPEAYYKPASMVFVAPAQIDNLTDIGQWWQIIEGADWQHPEGPDSDLTGRWDHPVVHIAYEDAIAFADWRGEDLPTEAEWEWAARGGLVGQDYTWGDQHPTKEQPRANHWQGVFPLVNLNWDGFQRTAPVGCFEANGYGLYDMAGNVWEWTKDSYAATGEHVIKGGSYLCADNFCGRYRPAARQGGAVDGGTDHIGFRTVKR